jgi:hypothetical protein
MWGRLVLTSLALEANCKKIPLRTCLHFVCLIELFTFFVNREAALILVSRRLSACEQFFVLQGHWPVLTVALQIDNQVVLLKNTFVACLGTIIKLVDRNGSTELSIDLAD